MGINQLSGNTSRGQLVKRGQGICILGNVEARIELKKALLKQNR
jgi:hypothetical protein